MNDPSYEHLKCPDCNCELSVFDGPGGSTGVRLMHDPTCPTWNSPDRRDTLRKKLPKAKFRFNTDTGKIEGFVPDTFRN